MGCTPRLLASLANSNAPHRFVSVKRKCGIPILLRPGQQLVYVGRSNSEGVEALGVKLDVAGGHCDCTRLSGGLSIPAVAGAV